MGPAGKQGASWNLKAITCRGYSESPKISMTLMTLLRKPSKMKTLFSSIGFIKK